MAGDFTETTLGRLLSFANGRSSPIRADSMPYPVYGSNGVIRRASETNADEGSIIIGRVGSYCGSLYLSKQRCWVTDNAIRATALDDNDSRFLFYLLGMLSLNSWRAGSGQPLLNQDILSRIPAAVPEPAEQRAIAHILGTLDDKIEMNRRMNETLEAMARALFKSWFVDFDPVRAKMEGRDPGLPQHIAGLFPDRLVDSELGETPQGWAIFRLDELVDHHTKSMAPSSLPEVEFEHFSIPAYDAGPMPAIDRGGDIKSNKIVVPSGAVLLSKLNPEIPRVWMPDAPNGCVQISSTEFLAFTPRGPANRSLLFSLFTDAAFRTMLQSMVTGTSKSHQRVPPKALKQNKVLSGTPISFSIFGGLTVPMLARVVKNRAESYTLATLRDALLPKLISGELRVTDAEKFIGG